MTNETITPAAQPQTDRQRTYLRRLIDRTTDLSDQLRSAKAYAEAELAGLNEGTLRFGGAHGLGLARTAAQIMATRAQIATMIESRGTYDLTEEQIKYAIHLGMTSAQDHGDREATWLYGNLSKNR